MPCSCAGCAAPCVASSSTTAAAGPATCSSPRRCSSPSRSAGSGRRRRSARRVHRVLAAAVDALREGEGVEVVLWRMWSASGLAGPWRDAALGGGPGGGRADRDLDAVLGLFDAAARFVDRLPGASPADFLDHVLGQHVAGDTLVARAPSGESVALVTPAASAGLEWDLVVVAGVQEGVWPDLRLRGSLLGLRPTSSTSSPVAAATRVRLAPRCATTRPGCSSSRSPGRGAGSSSPRCAATTSSRRRSSTSSTRCRCPRARSPTSPGR